MNPSEQRLRGIFMRSPIGMFRSTPGGQFLEVNPAAATMFGCENPEEMIAWVNRMGIAETIFQNPRDRAIFVEEMLAHYGAWEVREVRYLRKDGNPLDAILSICLQDDPEIEGPVLYGIIQDITERNRQEADRLRSEKLMVLGQLASGVAHDFNNFLSGILGYADLLITESDPVKVKSLADRLQKVVQQARGFTSRMLSFSKEKGIEAEPFNANELVRNAVGLFQAGSRTGIKVIMALSDQEAILLGSPDQFQNAVLNLCINARDAMPGGGRLRVESSITQGEGHLEGEGPGEIPPGVCYHLSVQDSGMGMSPEVLARCMDPFFTTKREGTGLGLPSVKNAVAELGGGLRITSREGEGCCFNIYLPLAEQGRRSPGVMLASAGVSSLDWFP